MANSRKVAVSMLTETEKNNSYSNIVIDKKLSASDLSPSEKKFATVIYLGVLERKITLDYIISVYCQKKIDIEVQQILRTAFYQMLYMDSVPDRAVVSESVKLASAFRKKSAGGFINAVLRSFLRDNKIFKYPQNEYDMLSVKYSIPLPLLKTLIKDYGRETVEKYLESCFEKPPLMIRRNKKAVSEEEFEKNFSEGKIKKHEIISDCYYYNSSDITREEAFKKGLFHVQDGASQLCCMAVDIDEKTKTVLDVCAAPGGKTFTMAENMTDDAVIYSCDIYPQRTKLIADGAERLGLKNVKTVTADASVLNDEIPFADRILCDVPCSGYGVIGKKPEIKYKDIEQNKDLPEIQYKILCAASKKLKIGGVLVYSTCTLCKAENEENIEKFLEEHKDFKAENPLPQFEKTKDMKYVTLFPEMLGTDGFFISKIRKIK